MMRFSPVCLLSLLALLTLGACYDVPPPGNTARFRTTADGPPTVRCQSNLECEDGQVCYAGACVTGCRSTLECDEGLVCKGNPPACVFDNGCDNDTECLPGERCHPRLNTCVDCLNASDCSGSDVCNIAEACLNRERECRNDDYSCGGCTLDEQCGLSQCDVGSGRCVDCSTDDDCPGTYCDLERFTCGQCYTDEHCPIATPACLRDEVAGNACVACVTDEHCPGGTCDMESNTCQGCSSNAECDEGKLCNATSGLCYNPECVFQEAPDRFEATEVLRVPVAYAHGDIGVAPLFDADESGELDGSDLAFVVVPQRADLDTELAMSVLALDGTRFWASSGFAGPNGGQAQVDLDGDGFVETIALRGERLIAYTFEGEVLWTSGSRTNHRPVVADVDLDGDAELIAGNALFDHHGNRVWAGEGANVGSLGGHPGEGVAADLQDAAGVEVVVGGTVYAADGQVLCTTGTDGWAQVADLDQDGRLEIVVVEEQGVGFYDATCNPLFDLVQVAGHSAQAGPPIVLNLDTSAQLEVVYVAGPDKVVALDALGNEKWSADLVGAAPFARLAASDVDNNGLVEVYVQDSEGLHVIHGVNGSEQAMIDAVRSGVTPLTGPKLADIDGDEALELLFLEGVGAEVDLVVLQDTRDRWRAGQNHSGGAILGSDIGIAQDYDGLPVEPGLVRSWNIDKPAPNLIIRYLPGGIDVGACPSTYIAIVGIANLGVEPLAAGALVRARSMEDGQVLLETTTQRPLQAGDEIFFQLNFTALLGQQNVEVVVTPSVSDQLLYGECELDDNRLVLIDAGCSTQ